MYAYAGASATASQLTPFTEPPQTTNNSAAPMQAAAVTQSSTVAGSNTATQLSHLTTSVPSALQSLATTNTTAATTASTGLVDLPPVPPALTEWNNIFSTIASGPYSLQGLTSIPGGPFLSFGQVYSYAQNGQGLAAFGAPKAITGALAPLTSGAVTPHLSSAVGGEPVSGAMGKAALVGRMSVPQSWTEAAPAIRTLASVLPSNMAAAPEAAVAGEGGAFSQMALSSLAGRAVAASATYSGGGAAAKALGGAVVEADPAAATIIVIPALED
jgi:PPE-repeat protein